MSLSRGGFEFEEIFNGLIRVGGRWGLEMEFTFFWIMVFFIIV